MRDSKSKHFIIRTWLEVSGFRRWRATVTDVETRRSQGFTRFEDLVQHLETQLDANEERKEL
jgi:hypothetical protein